MPGTSMMTPSVLFVTTVPITLEAFLIPFAEHFRSQGWRVDALANGATSNPHIDGVFDARYDVAWSRNPLHPGNLIGTPGAVRRIVADGGYDVVHVHTPVAAFVTRFALRRLPRESRPVVIYTAHGFHFYRGQRKVPHAIFRTMERTAGRWTDYLVTINREDFEAARGFGTIDSERVRYIPGIGVDVDLVRSDPGDPIRRETLRQELGVASDAFMITVVAEFIPRKRHAHLLDALSRVREPRVVVVFVGQGVLEPELRAEVDKLGLAERVRFAGYRRDVPEVLAASDALALVSEHEGLARSVLEAMAAGKPVIGTDTRGIADAVADAGWIVPKDDTAALTAVIDRAAGHPEESARRGRAARLRVEAEFALPRIIAAYEGLYREALASGV
jgi:glycosyltransferase involved in cell wall biosynthesis